MAPKVMPIVLKVVMRHQSIETTLMHCVGLNADRTGDALCRVQGAILAGTCWILSLRLIRPTHQKARKLQAKNSGGHGTRTRSPLRGTSVPVRPLTNSLILRWSPDREVAEAGPDTR